MDVPGERSRTLRLAGDDKMESSWSWESTGPKGGGSEGLLGSKALLTEGRMEDVDVSELSSLSRLLSGSRSTPRKKALREKRRRDVKEFLPSLVLLEFAHPVEDVRLTRLVS